MGTQATVPMPVNGSNQAVVNASPGRTEELISTDRGSCSASRTAESGREAEGRLGTGGERPFGIGKA